jgi:cyclopropane fatty-acyl-phospholipid synthase-like methyltransferase
MNSTDALVKLLVTEAGFRSEERARYYCTSVYRDTPLKDAAVLEIGCGLGWLSLYAACEGARRVVGLEPEADGSSGGEVAEFKRMGAKLGLGQIEVRSETIQQYDPGQQRFDVILISAAVNHLDEQACINLKRSEEARNIYRTLFRRFHEVMNPGGRIIITESSRYNLWGAVGIKNPFAPQIEWRKHQSPRIWIKLLRECGFRDASLAWRMPRALEPLGALTANEAVAYLIWSRFILIMSRS